MDFKYKIGDVLYAKTGIVNAMKACEMGQLCWPKALLVLETLHQTCHAGIEQKHYVMSENGNRVQMCEMELVPTTDWNPTAALQALFAAKTAQPKTATTEEES